MARRGAKPQFFYVVCPAVRVRRYYSSGGMIDENSVPISMGRVTPSTVGTAGPMAGIPIPASIPGTTGRGPDSIEYVVDQLAGKTLRVDSPDGFAKAVGEIARTLGSQK